MSDKTRPAIEDFVQRFEEQDLGIGALVCEVF